MTGLSRRAIAGGTAAFGLALSGCSDSTGGPATEGESTTDSAAAEGSGDTGANDAEPAVVPAYWSLEGALTIEAGSVLADDAAWTFQFFDAENNTLCLRSAQIAQATVSPTTPSAPVWGWWTATWTPTDPTPLPVTDTDEAMPCTPALPASTTFGFGAPDPRLNTAMEQRGFSSTSAYYAAYFAADAARTFVFGIGSAAGGEPFSDLATAAPLPDGTYELHTLYLLPYTP